MPGYQELSGRPIFELILRCRRAQRYNLLAGLEAKQATHWLDRIHGW